MRGQPIETQVAVLYERVKNLGDEVQGLRRALWSFVFSILGGAILFLLSVAQGWLGPHSGNASALFGWLF